ncbi:MAG: hypothetical protein D6814_17645, partial [Calditrichaeota bacterium]
VDRFYPFVAERGFIRKMVLHAPVDLQNAELYKFSQIAYNIRPMFMATLARYRWRREKKYARQAATYAAWFLGKNVAGIPMYDPNTGRCFDGILSPTRINRNAGAESTIEALRVMLEVDHEPEIRRMLKVFGNEVMGPHRVPANVLLDRRYPKWGVAQAMVFFRELIRHLRTFYKEARRYEPARFL